VISNRTPESKRTGSLKCGGSQVKGCQKPNRDRVCRVVHLCKQIGRGGGARESITNGLQATRFWHRLENLVTFTSTKEACVIRRGGDTMEIVCYVYYRLAIMKTRVAMLRSQSSYQDPVYSALVRLDPEYEVDRTLLCFDSDSSLVNHSNVGNDHGISYSHHLQLVYCLTAAISIYKDIDQRRYRDGYS
jgi:hypothetical protein